MNGQPLGMGLHPSLLGYPGAVVELTLDGVVSDSNGKLEDALGRPLVGLPFGEILDPTSQAKYSRLLAERSVGKEAPSWELIIVGRAGLELRAFTVVWGSDESADALWLIEHTHDERLERLYDELAAANSELVGAQRALAKERARLVQALEVQRNAVRLRDNVLAVVAHDLRNPMDRISASLSMLLDESLAAESRTTLLAVMGRTVAGMNRLVRDLLDAASIDSGQLAWERKEITVASLIEAASELYRSNAAAKNVRLDCSADFDSVVFADDGRVLQVIGNLLTNAIRLTPPGGHVALRAEHDGERVVLSVSDTGPGIAPHELPFIFDRFWQGARERRGSAGLGLAIAKGIVEAHGERIWVESEVARGTTFFFTVPSTVDGAVQG